MRKGSLHNSGSGKLPTDLDPSYFTLGPNVNLKKKTLKHVLSIQIVFHGTNPCDESNLVLQYPLFLFNRTPYQLLFKKQTSFLSSNQIAMLIDSKACKY